MRTETLRVILEAQGFPVREDGASLAVGKGKRTASLAVETGMVTATAAGTAGAKFLDFGEEPPAPLSPDFLAMPMVTSLARRIRAWLGTAGVKAGRKPGNGRDWLAKVPEGAGPGFTCRELHSWNGYQVATDGKRMIWREGPAVPPCERGKDCLIQKSIPEVHGKFRALAAAGGTAIQAEDIMLACRQAKALDPKNFAVTLTLDGKGTARVTAESCGIGEFAMELTARGTAAGIMILDRDFLADVARDGGTVEIFPAEEGKPWGFLGQTHAHLICPMAKKK